MVIALPARARAEAGEDHGGAFLDGHLEIAAHPHRELNEAVALAELAERAEPDARVVGILRLRRNRHEASHLQGRHRRDRVEDLAEPLGAHTALGRLAGDVHLHQRIHRPAPGAGPLVELPGQVQAVERVDDVEQL